MQTYHVGIISLLVFGAFVIIAFLSWRSKIRKQEAFVQAPEALSSVPVGFSAFYVATTFAGRPLDRVLAHGLAHRGKAQVAVGARGIEVHRVGELSFMIPAPSVVEIARASAVIDRAVEKDGLVSVRWRLGELEVESHFRFVSTADRESILTSLAQSIGK